MTSFQLFLSVCFLNILCVIQLYEVWKKKVLLLKFELLAQKKKHILALQTNQDDPSIREQLKQIAMEARQLRSSSLCEKGIHYTSSSKYQIHKILKII